MCWKAVVAQRGRHGLIWLWASGYDYKSQRAAVLAARRWTREVKANLGSRGHWQHTMSRYSPSAATPKRGDRGTFAWQGDSLRPCECEILSVGKPTTWNIYVIKVRYRDLDNGKIGRGYISHGGFNPAR